MIDDEQMMRAADAEIEHWHTEAVKAYRERDEARAEVERLKAERLQHTNGADRSVSFVALHAYAVRLYRAATWARNALMLNHLRFDALQEVLDDTAPESVRRDAEREPGGGA